MIMIVMAVMTMSTVRALHKNEHDERENNDRANVSGYTNHNRRQH